MAARIVRQRGRDIRQVTYRWNSRKPVLWAKKGARAAMVAMVLGTGAIVLSACQSKEISSKDFVDNIQPADLLYNQALASMDEGNLTRAMKKLNELDRQHPYSEFSRRALIMQTFISYRQGNYIDSAEFGKRYVSLYPGDKDAAYAQYLVGMSYYRQMPDVSRDQSVTARAHNAMLELTERYPESEYVEDAKTKMRVTRDQVAGKEMLTGRYYLERREYLAAINRFRKVVQTYPDTRHVEEGLARLTEAYYAMGLANEAQAAAAVLGHNFPDSQWYKDSVALLQSGGLVPRENKRSWLSGFTTDKPQNSRIQEINAG
jgi:outer membrane protein assembly factor BamD